MTNHRSTLRLRFVRPVLLSQDNLQPNTSQEFWPTDFEGSLFNRLLCQGSGLHPQTGSPQDQWAFSFAQESWNRLAACSSGVLAVLFGSGQSPVTCRHYFQKMNQGRGLGSGAALSAFVSWLIWPSKNVIRSLALARSALSCSTSAPSASRACGSSGMLINHLLFTMVPVITPLVNLRLMVFGETPRAIAASCIESCMAPMVNHHGYAEPWLSVKPLPKLPMLSKCNHG